MGLHKFLKDRVQQRNQPTDRALRTMPLVLEKAGEADIDRMIEVMYAAMSQDSWYRIVFPTTPQPSERTPSVQRWKKDMHTNPAAMYMKVTDSDRGGEIVSFAKWLVYERERPESEWKKEEKREWDAGAYAEAGDAFLSAVYEKRQRIMGGKAHCCEDGWTIDILGEMR